MCKPSLSMWDENFGLNLSKKTVARVIWLGSITDSMDML